MEKIYIGTKIIAAEPMSEGKFKDLKSASFLPILPQDGLKDGPDYGREGYKVRYEDGYVSWSPKEVFERAYREITTNEREMIYPGTKWAKASVK